MTDKKQEGCVSAAAGPIAPKPQSGTTTAGPPGPAGKEERMALMVGKEAPDFEASAYHEGGFKNIRLSDFRGKWVFLCFYPGDFTFV